MPFFILFGNCHFRCSDFLVIVIVCNYCLQFDKYYVHFVLLVKLDFNLQNNSVFLSYQWDLYKPTNAITFVIAHLNMLNPLQKHL